MEVMSSIELQSLKQQVAQALAEDLSAVDAELDITAQLIAKDTRSDATIITREPMVMCGMAWVNEVFQQLDPEVNIDWQVTDGDHVDENTVLCQLSGSSRSLLTGERTALNFLQTLAGTATLTARYTCLLYTSPSPRDS